MVEITPIQPQHVDGFWKVLDDVAREQKYLARQEAPPLDAVRSFVMRNIEKGYPHFVAICAEQIVGWCDIIPQDLPAHAHCADLGIALLPNFRHQGIGSALMQVSLKAAKAYDLKRITLTVYADNTTAIGFYQRFGLQAEGLQRQAALLMGVYHDVVCMGLLFEDTQDFFPIQREDIT